MIIIFAILILFYFALLWLVLKLQQIKNDKINATKRKRKRNCLLTNEKM